MTHTPIIIPFAIIDQGPSKVKYIRTQDYFSIKKAEKRCAFIIKAVNCHDELVGTLEFISQVDKYGDCEAWPEAIERVEKALAKAEGNEQS